MKFCSTPRPSQGRFFLAPRAPSAPAPVPTLASARANVAPSQRLGQVMDGHGSLNAKPDGLASLSARSPKSFRVWLAGSSTACTSLSLPRLLAVLWRHRQLDSKRQDGTGVLSPL